MYFTDKDWSKNPDIILNSILDRFGKNGTVAVRSSVFGEDGKEVSNAGAYLSLLHIPAGDTEAVVAAVNQVISSYGSLSGDVLVQKMVLDVQVGGVAMTRNLDDGSPYYVINYDDVSGKTDTITGGIGENKTVYIYFGNCRKGVLYGNRKY